MKLLLLASILINPLTLTDEVVNENEIVENENVENTQESEEVANELVETENTDTENNVPNTETENTNDLSKDIEQLVQDNAWLQDIIKSVGIVYGAVGGGSLLTLIGVVIRTIYTSIKSKKVSKETLTSVKGAILDELQATVGNEITQKIEQPINELTKTIANLEKMQSILGKIVALSQEDTYGSRLAILEAIATLNVVEPNIIETAKVEIEKEQEKEIETKEKAHDNLETIIKETETELPNIKI